MLKFVHACTFGRHSAVAKLQFSDNDFVMYNDVVLKHTYSGGTYNA